MVHQKRMRLGVIGALVFVVPGWARAAEQAQAAEDLAALAIQANPAIKSMEKQIQALGYKIESVKMWADPVLAVDYVNVPWDSWALGESPMSGVGVKLKQTFPLPGKNARRQAVVSQEQEIKNWELLERKNKLGAMVKMAFWKLALVRNLKAITARHIALVDQLVLSVRAKYQVGKSGQHDLLRLKVLKKKLSDDLGDFAQQDTQLRASINAALHRSGSQAIATPATLRLHEPKLNLGQLLRLARKNRPLLKQVQAQATWHRKAAQAAAFERWPDITLWAGYRVRTRAGADPGKDFFSVGLAVPLPFDFASRHAAKESMNLTKAAAVDQVHQAKLDEIGAALESALATWMRAVQKANTYRKQLVPAADKTLQATLVAYRSDRTDFSSLYQAELQLLEFQRAIQIARASARIERVRIEFEIGTRIPKPGQ